MADIKHPSESRVGTSIAVLPFRNMSADPGNEYFSDGLSESIINTLGRVRDLKVVARTSAFSFKGKDVDVREIGRQLNAGHVLEGGVQRTGTRLRITAQLIDASDGCQLWSERYDRSIDDIFAIQDEISLAIVGKLDIRPPKTEKARIVRRHTEDPEAYNLYLKGRFFYNKRTEEDLNRSLGLYRAAIDRDPAFALPYAGLADSYATLGFYYWMPYEEARQKAKEAAMKGLEIDDTIGETHAAYANVILWFFWQWAGAEEEYRKAIHLSPSDVEARHMYAHLLESLGHFDDALDEMGKALELEPLSVNLNTCLAQILFFARRYDEAIERLEKTIEMDPGFPLQYFWLGRAYLQKGMLREAVAMFEGGAKYPTIRAIALAGLGYVRAIEGRADEVQRVLKELEDLSRKGKVSPYFLGFLHAGRRDKAAALDHLERAYDEGDMYLCSLKVDPAFDDLRDEPRFRDLLVKTGLTGSPAAEATISLSPPKTPLDGPGQAEVEGRIGHYRLVGKIGEGGMGVVYKAEDTKLRRTVALKFLPPEFTRDDVARARFLREARTAASLDHPYICTVFEINEQAGRTFIAMAFIEGRSLKDRIAEGPMGTAEAKTIALQVGEGLKAAHARGIVHRDIKPGNIMLTPEGRVKILDFGLAKLDQGADVTLTTGILGTVAYMSPEQARGETVDRRTDIWSFGATLYEMLTGSPPFGKRAEQPLIYAVLNEEPKPMRDMRPDIPRAAEQIVLKALQKDPTRRYQSVDEMLEDLEGDWPSVTVVPESRKSIIVLPFENISPEPEQDYFCDGMTEEIITDLSHIHDLLVISRSSAMTFKGTKKTIPEIARTVNVRYVLEGSVRKAGNKLRITAQLIEAESDKHLWAEKFDGVLEDVFEIQEKVSRRIVEALKGRLTSKDRRQLSARPSFPNVGVYEAYSRAQFEFWKSEPESTERALHLLNKAIGVFGEHPLLLSGIGAIHWQLYHYRGDVNEAHLARIKECAEKLFAIDAGSAHGHRLSSYLALHSGHSGEAVRHLRRSMEGDPNDTETLLWLSYLLAIHAGRPEQARPVAERWLAVDPLHPISRMSLILVQWMKGEFEEASGKLEEWHRQEPDNRVAAFYHGHLLAWRGRRQESLELAEKMCREDPEETMGQALRFAALAIQGRPDEAKNALTPQVRGRLWMDFHLPWVVAEGYAVLGDGDEALRWLERAVEKGNVNYPVLSELDPLLADIRGEPRFKTLMERVKRDWEDFDA